MSIFRLSNSPIFPDPREAEPNGLLAIGGDLGLERLLLAYSMGIFPWFGPDEPLLWWSPAERAVFLPGEEHFSKRTERALRRIPFEIRMDTAFEQVMLCCSKVPRLGQNGTWITPGMIEAYVALHRAGYAHSVEAWMDGKLAGGLYGVSLGATFFGESMFSLTDYASRASFKALCKTAWDWGFHFIDGQFPNENLDSLGATTIPRHNFLGMLEGALEKPTRQGSWN
ncbi:MAG: leucyl/phenylalanyl-tRNA--protein transferase [Holophagaceae bacterium]|nr:leucyl/phenylalanyl-tRNA--protein transferase [Holophagaceae bacterium]